MLPICKFCVGCYASYWTVDVTTLEFHYTFSKLVHFLPVRITVWRPSMLMRLAGCSPHGLFSKLLLSVLWRGCCEILFSIVFLCDKCRRFDGKRASPPCVPKCCPLPDELFFHLSQSVASANSKTITRACTHYSVFRCGVSVSSLGRRSKKLGLTAMLWPCVRGDLKAVVVAAPWRHICDLL